MQCVAVCSGVLQCIAVCCSVLQCVTVCCSVLQCVAVSYWSTNHAKKRGGERFDCGLIVFWLCFTNSTISLENFTQAQTQTETQAQTKGIHISISTYMYIYIFTYALAVWQCVASIHMYLFIRVCFAVCCSVLQHMSVHSRMFSFPQWEKPFNHWCFPLAVSPFLRYPLLNSRSRKHLQCTSRSQMLTCLRIAHVSDTHMHTRIHKYI